MSKDAKSPVFLFPIRLVVRIYDIKGVAIKNKADVNIRVKTESAKSSLKSHIVYGNFSLSGMTGKSALSARSPWPISRRFGPRSILMSPVANGGK